MVLWLFLNSHSTKFYLQINICGKTICTCTQKLCVFIFKFIFKLSLISAALKVLDMQSLVFHCPSFCLSVFLRQSLIFSGQVLSSSLMMIVFSLLFYQVAGSCMPCPKIQVCTDRSICFTCQVCYKRETGAINKVLFIKSLEFCTEIHNLKPTRIETKIHVGRILEGSGWNQLVV